MITKNLFSFFLSWVINLLRLYRNATGFMIKESQRLHEIYRQSDRRMDVETGLDFRLHLALTRSLGPCVCPSV